MYYYRSLKFPKLFQLMTHTWNTSWWVYPKVFGN